MEIIKSIKSIRIVSYDAPKYELTLSEEEMQALYDITRHVGGNPKDSARKHTDTIMKILKNDFGFMPKNGIQGVVTFIKE